MKNKNKKSGKRYNSVEELVDKTSSKEFKKFFNTSTVKEIYIKCACQCGVCKIEKEQDGTYNFSIFKRDPSTIKQSLKQRLKWCWHILINKDIWTDYLVFYKEDAEKIKKFFEETL